ncbi:hypothetical protein [Streptomyces anulatus]|uniref:hypothetical protein n=1 Tax=Streptomyces anulatus TaxID=1892 RepID=UPI003648D735
MSHRPYPDADRALRQVHRGRIHWVQPADSFTPWLLNVRQAFSILRLPAEYKGLPHSREGAFIRGPEIGYRDALDSPYLRS